MTINSFVHETLSSGIPIVMGKDNYDLQDIQDGKSIDPYNLCGISTGRGVRKIQRR